MSDFMEELPSKPFEELDIIEARRAGFRYANASLALSGLIVSEIDQARQEEVIQGRLTTTQAIALCVAEYSELK